MAIARVLLIEDNAANMDLARYILEAHGFACHEARDGETGVKAARERRPDLVLCDLRLPGIDGFGVLRALRADVAMAGVPIVALTAYAMVGDRDRVLSAGFDGYLAKPLDPQRFAHQVAGFLDVRLPDAGQAPTTPTQS
ncbi:response regulator [Ramlibacter sp. WS9]|uniref:response regulator n=1 Tax=Ramlibacter sp. WS9 TaxID=1882741 RepID=UPI0011435684|nr:response regulator [Ramlibacter sp. WS9]ROZ68575.1 response regulator [Ramlibacter sp. WS9]